MRLAPIAQVGGDDLEATRANGVPSGRGARRCVLQNPHSSIEMQGEEYESSPGLDEAKQALLHPPGDDAERPALARVRRMHAHATAADLEGQALADAGDTGAETPNQPEGHLLSQDEVRTLVRTHCDSGLLARVRHYARKIAAAVSEAGGFGGDAYAEDLLQDALADTLAGVLRWDPEVATLESHLMSRIRSRGRDTRRRAVAYPHVSIDAPADEESDAPSPVEEAEAAWAVLEDQGQWSRSEEHLQHLFSLAAEDEEVWAVLTVLRTGNLGREDILRITGLSARAYRNARHRLAVMGRQVAEGSRAAR